MKTFFNWWWKYTMLFLNLWLWSILTMTPIYVFCMLVF